MMVFSRILPRVIQLVLPSVIIIFAGCGPNLAKLRNAPPEEQWEVGKALYEDGDFANAQIILDRVARINVVSTYSDSAQFLLAESYYNTKDYILAQSEYDRLIKRTPGSPLAKESMYKKALSYFALSGRPELDQDYSLKAIRGFEEFMDEYPDDTEFKAGMNENIKNMREKLAEKEFLSAELYRKMHNNSSAIIYYDLVLREYYDTAVASKALVKKSQAYENLKQYGMAKETLQIFLSNFPEHELFMKASEKMSVLKAVIASGDTTQVPF